MFCAKGVLVHRKCCVLPDEQDDARSRSMKNNTRMLIIVIIGSLIVEVPQSIMMFINLLWMKQIVQPPSFYTDHVQLITMFR
jgi:hypothetical protein